MILLKMWLFLMIISIISAVIGVLVFSKRYGIPMIFKYDFYCGNWGVLTLSESIWLVFFTYLSIVCKSRDTVTSLITIVMPAWSIYTKSAMTSDLMFFNTLLRLAICLAMCLLENSMNLVLFSLLIEIITCFLDSFFVVIFTLGFGFLLPLIILWILPIFLTYNLENISLIFRILLVVGIEAWVYDLPLFFFYWFGTFLNFLRRFHRDQ